MSLVAAIGSAVLALLIAGVFYQLIGLARSAAAPRHFVKVFGPTAARTLERLVGEVRKLPSDIHPVVQALWCQPKCFPAMADHLRVLQDAAASAAEAGPIGDVPLVVISSADQTPDVMAAHEALARGSPQGRHVVASSSSHWVQFDEPELVIETIREMVDVVRHRRLQ
jgi:pimeloyl-ACP methyl ester carboxylesterase